MKDRCIEEVNAHLGRQATKDEIEKIEAALSYHQKSLKRDQHTNGWSDDDVWREAATRAAAETKADATKKAQRISLQVITNARVAEQYAELKAVHGTGRKALGRIIEQTGDVYIKGIRQETIARLVDTIDAADPRFFKMLENPEAVRDFLREGFGHDTGNPIAKKGAETFGKVMEDLRMRANRAGFNIGKLDYAWFPLPHDVVAMAKAKVDGWIQFVMPRLARDRYLTDAGTRMTDAELAPMLRKMYETITTYGTNKLEIGEKGGSGMRANRNGDHRQLHFDGPDATQEYIQAFGKGNIFDAIEGHVGSMARDIGLVEKFGPNPQAHFDMLEQLAIKDDHGVNKGYGFMGVRTRDAWNAISHANQQNINPRFAEAMKTVRDVTVGNKLTGTFLNSLPDIATLMAAALYNQQPLSRVIGSVFKEMGPQGKKHAERLGVVSEQMMADMNQWSRNHFTSGGWAKKYAATTMKLSLLQGFTDIFRRGFSLDRMAQIADMTKRSWESLHPRDRELLEQAGATSADWQVWQAAPKQDWNGVKVLHHDDIREMRDLVGSDAERRVYDHAIATLVGHIANESEFASIAPDVYTHAALKRGLQNGTVEGEFANALLLFKSFPVALISRWGRRIAELDVNAAGRVGLGMTLAAGMTLLGGLSSQLQAIAVGKDPYDVVGPHAGKFWMAAAARGGGLGIYGDVLYTGMGGNSQGGAPNWLGLTGPVFGTAFDAGTLVLGNIHKAGEGKKTDVAAESLRFARGNIPGSNLTNLWYTKAAVDHMFFHQMQEAASPGYLGRMRERAQRDFGQRFWWQPGKPLPDRAPDLAHAVDGK